MLVRNTSNIKKISDFISQGKQSSLTTTTFNQSFTVQNTTLPIRNILIDKYSVILKQHSYEVDFDDEKVYQSIKYNPRRLSLILYGTTDLWHLLLWINNMKSTTEFTKKKIYVFDPEKLDIINDIINKESHILKSTVKVDTNVIVKDS